MRRLATTALVFGFAISFLGASPAAVRAAAPTSPPTITGPANGSTQSDNPILGWSALTGAAKYRVQISTSPTFSGSLAYSQDTTTLHATPTTELPYGTFLAIGPVIAMLWGNQILGWYLGFM